MKYEELRAAGYKLHHAALFRGYISRKVTAELYPYAGKFGTGYRAKKNNPKSNRYSVVEYWVK